MTKKFIQLLLLLLFIGSPASIFEAQKDKYVNTDEMVSILNSFPIFLYDYLK